MPPSPGSPVEPIRASAPAPAAEAVPGAPRVYVDPAVVAVRTGDEPAERLGPDAEPALRHLVEAGFEVLLLDAGPLVDDACRAVGGLVGGAATPEAGADGAWLVTGDPAACVASRPTRGLRTILVGPGAPGRPPVTRPCDLEARTLLDAVLEILAADAMPSRPGSARAAG